jgi:hypothetical protein
MTNGPPRCFGAGRRLYRRSEVHRGSGCKLRVMLQGRNDPRCSEMVSGHGGGQGALHACVDASGTAEGWKRGRGPSAFLGRYLSRHPRPEPGADVLPQAHRSRPPRTTDARSGEPWAPREGRGRSRMGPREGTVRGIAHRAKPEWWAAGRCGGKGVPEKTRMALCRASIPLPFPTSPEKPVPSRRYVSPVIPAGGRLRRRR